jgi:hypothetical protein
MGNKNSVSKVGATSREKTEASAGRLDDAQLDQVTGGLADSLVQGQVSSTDQATDKRRHNPITIRREVDAASPKLLQ